MNSTVNMILWRKDLGLNIRVGQIWRKKFFA